MLYYFRSVKKFGCKIPKRITDYINIALRDCVWTFRFGNKNLLGYRQ